MLAIFPATFGTGVTLQVQVTMAEAGRGCHDASSCLSGIRQVPSTACDVRLACTAGKSTHYITLVSAALSTAVQSQSMSDTNRPINVDWWNLP